MSNQRLKYVTKSVISVLRDDISKNISRYKEGDFSDLASGDGWDLEMSSMDVDLSYLENLDPGKGAEREISNSLLVWQALHNLTPALACEERIWVRLSHVECLEYSRKRWLENSKDDEKLIKDVEKHFFVKGLPGYRDDHAVSRLWWNAYTAKTIRPDDPKRALNLIIKTADIRSNIVERSSTGRRVSVSAALLRLMEKEEAVTSSEQNFRKVMKVVNRQCGGVLFEALGDAEADAIMEDCFHMANLTA